MPTRPPKSMQGKTGIFLFSGIFTLLMLVAATGPADAQKAKVSFSDDSGYEYSGYSYSLDVPYVPTPMKVVRTLLDLAVVGPEDFLIDLGSGDGRIVITAAKEYGAGGFGVDLNSNLVSLSKENAAAEGVEKKVDFFVRDIFDTDIRAASVVTMYLLTEINIQMRPKLLSELKPGVRIVSHDFHMGEWHPDKMIKLAVKKYYREDTTLYLWIVPAKVVGRWQWRLPLSGAEQSFNLELSQSYQNLDGTAKYKDYILPIFDAGITGDRIRFSLFVEGTDRMIRHDYTGRVEGDTLVGTVQMGNTVVKSRMEWRATRAR